MSVSVEAVDADGDGIANDPGIIVRIPIPVSTCPGDDLEGDEFTATMGTKLIAGSRFYYTRIMTGPEAGFETEFQTVSEVEGVIETVLLLNGFDLSAPAVIDLRDQAVGLITDNWISPSQFYSTYGF